MVGRTRQRLQEHLTRRLEGLEVVTVFMDRCSEPIALVLFAFIMVSIAKDSPTAREAIKPDPARYLGSLHPQPFLRDAGISEEETEPCPRALLNGREAAELVTDRQLRAERSSFA